MTVHHGAFTLPATRAPSFRDVTGQVEQVLQGSGIRDGILVVFSQHTTCSVLIQEASDDVDYWGTELLMQDLVTALEKITPTCRTQASTSTPDPGTSRRVSAATRRRPGR